MKITREYEASDIKLDDPEIAPYLMITVIAALSMGKRDNDDPEDKTLPARRAIAAVRTAVEQGGWVIVKKEDVPAVYREAADA